MSRIESVVLADEVYSRLKIMILEGGFQPGDRIDRKKIASGFGVSSTPVNEAVARLLGERFLERRFGGRDEEGLFVPDMPFEDLVHVFAVRAGFEGSAGRLAVEAVLSGADPALLDSLCVRFYGLNPPFDVAKTERYLAEDKLFHEGIIAASRNPILADIDNNLGCVHRSWIKGLVRPPEETLDEHRAIIAAFRDRDPVRAQNLLIDHNLRSRDVLLARTAAAK